jgi:hypothetical protein
VDDIPRNSASARDAWDRLEGRGPGGPANVVDFPLSPPPHISKAQIIRADAGILPTVVTPTEPVSRDRASRLFLRAARSALSKFLAGEWLSDEEARYLEALNEARKQEDKP